MDGYFFKQIHFAILWLSILLCIGSCSHKKQGKYFNTDRIPAKPLPVYDKVKEKLPEPLYEENSRFVDCYWKAWEIAFNNFHKPTIENGFVSNYIDAAFTHANDIFFWDTGFMTMFCNYAHPYVPGIQSMDNFYVKQHPDGEICRQISRETGDDYVEWVNKEDKNLFSRWGPLFRGGITWDVEYVRRERPTPKPVLTLDALNHPIAAWVELESYRITGDKERLFRVWEPLVQYYKALQKYIRQGNGLYITDWASMDNSPRNEFLENGGCGIDISAEMVLYGNCMSVIGDIIGEPDMADNFRKEAGELKGLINQHMWSEKDGFYFDLTIDGEKIPVKTIAAFWTLLAEVAGPSRAEYLFNELRNPVTFNRTHRVPTLAASEIGYDPLGSYWRGAVWAPTVTMVIRGLEKYNKMDLAYEIAMNHLRNVVEVYEQTGTIWENYAPDSVRQGNQALDEFVGWSGIGPIMFLLEYGIGIKANAESKNIQWNIRSPMKVGVRNFWFADITTTLICMGVNDEGKRKINIESDGDYELTVIYKGQKTEKEIRKGIPYEFRIEEKP